MSTLPSFLLIVTCAMCPCLSSAFSMRPILAPRIGSSEMNFSSPRLASDFCCRLPSVAAAQSLRRKEARRSSEGRRGTQMNIFVEGTLRILSCFPYILPMMDSLAYGRFLFQKVPLLSTIFMTPLQPFVELAQSFPMLSFVSFLGLFLFVVRNKKVPRFVRFNTMQALLLEIILIFPQILTSSNMGGLIPFMFTEFVSNMTFYSIVSIVAYSCSRVSFRVRSPSSAQQCSNRLGVELATMTRSCHAKQGAERVLNIFRIDDRFLSAVLKNDADKLH